MKHSNFSRFLSVLLALVMVLSMVPATVFADESATYTRVTADQTDWSGEYLLVYEAGSLAFDGSLSTPDAVNNYQSVTIDGDTITADRGIVQPLIRHTAGSSAITKQSDNTIIPFQRRSCPRHSQANGNRA